jgi:uncharacterized phage protein (TIGR01671 family)
MTELSKNAESNNLVKPLLANRLFKFRAWHKNAQEFTNLDFDINDYNFGWMVQHDGSRNPDDFVFMQFTGLTDKNGKEIYEGDIVKTNYGKMGVVKFHKKTASFIINDNEHFNCQLYQEMPYLEIIGNIYEKP